MTEPALAGSILDAIGRTPCLSLRRIAPPHVQLLGKLESLNPGGSVKDRIGVSMIRAAIDAGHLRPGMTIVEPTSGNTGIALAMAAAALRYPLVLTMPSHMSQERVSVMAAYGARIVLTPAEQDMDGAIRAAQEIVAQDPALHFMPQQFSNSANPQVHRDTTAPEILDAVGEARFDAFVAGVGTGGTITGVGHVLREQRPDTRIVAVEPSKSAVLSGGQPGVHGIQGIGAGFIPDVLDRELIDEVLVVDEEEAFSTTRRLAREEGLLVGPSAGANVAAALRLIERDNLTGTVVTILCDTGFRYFSVGGFIDDDVTA
ncbi:MAG: cysteine synthase A [Gemmatimonadetes bacterium]|jgi:cysteine synthase|nr:cysteine synthase A [Gemmatimonadota bacterium]MBT7859711.1 cysteine synthase A [Gemmatimonadota bacterium]